MHLDEEAALHAVGAGLVARVRVRYKSVLVIRLLVVLALLPGCVLIDRARYTEWKTDDELSGMRIVRAS